jgi:alkaline phosphatase
MMAAAVSGMLAFVAGLALSTGPLAAQTIYPIDRAAILAGARFDLKVEFPVIEKEANLKITINGEDYSRQFGKAGQFVENEDGLNASSLVLRDASIDKPGSYKVVASDGTRRSEVTWTVFATGPRVAKNVILFIGDGMSMANRTAARILSKGIKEGKYFAKLAMDDMPQMALVGTSGVDAITTDSANSMSAYTTGHKSSVNALGVLGAALCVPSVHGGPP